MLSTLMIKYLSTKNIENFKYDISTLKNEKDILKKEKDKLKEAEKIIETGKNLSRLYFALEIIFYIKNIISRSRVLGRFPYVFIRVNLFWLLSNFLVNAYLDKRIKPIIEKNKKLHNDSDFKKFISHKF